MNWRAIDRLAEARQARQGPRRARLEAVRAYAALRAVAAPDDGEHARAWHRLFHRVDEALALSSAPAELDRVAADRDTSAWRPTTRDPDPIHTRAPGRHLYAVRAGDFDHEP